MFVGRKKELDFLNQQYQSARFSFIPIYGRRRVGKTTLIREYIKDKKAIYYQATEEKIEFNLQRLLKSTLEVLFPQMSEVNLESKDFMAILDLITDYSQNNKIILVIDEYPYLAQVASEVSSLLQSVIDQQWKENSNLQLILCGSSMSFMERQVLGYKSPLYGRKTGQIKLKAFDFYQTKEYFPNVDSESLAEIYGITGGIPQYLEQIDPNLSVLENIKNNFLTKNSFLFEEPKNLLKQELNDPSNYNSILTSIAQGASRLNEISTKTKIPTSNLTRFLANLIDLDLVEKKRPLGVNNSKKTVYQIKDNLFRFWFRFVFPNISQIEIGVIDSLLSFIDQQLSHFMGKIFEEISITYLWNEMKNGKIPADYREFGNWWGTNNKNKCQEEIDILGIGFENDHLFFGECKWHNEAIDVDVVAKLIERSNLFLAPRKDLAIFAKRKFTSSAIALAKKNKIRLITYQDIYQNSD